MYSYPSYISIGNNNLDNINSNWSQGSFTDKKNSNYSGSSPVTSAQKSPPKGKQAQVKQLPNRTGSGKQAQHCKQPQPSKQAVVKQTVTKQSSSKQVVNKHVSGKQNYAQKSNNPAIGSRLKSIGNSKKQLVSAQNKRKATGEPAVAAKNAKIKKTNNKKQATKTSLLAKDVRRRSTNSMRLRKLTSAGEVCHDDSSESMSESERLAEAIRRSKLETRMTSSEAKKAEANGNLNNKDRQKYSRLLTGKHKLEEKGKKGSRFVAKKSHDRLVAANQHLLVGHVKSSVKKAKKGRKVQSAFPSMVVAQPKLDAKRSTLSHREAKLHPPLKRSASAPSKVPTTLMGKIIPIQAPMIWKLVNSSQEKSAPVDMAKIQNMKSNATLKFTGEQKVLIQFSQSNNNSSSTAVKTIIANVASSKSPPKNSTGVKMRQAVLMPISAVSEADSEAKTIACSGMNIVDKPVRLLRSTVKGASNIPNYSIIPLSSLIPSSSAASSAPHLLSTVQKTAGRTSLASAAHQLLAIPPKPNAPVIASMNQTLVSTTATTVMSVAAAARTKLTSAPTAVKLIVVSSLSSSLQSHPPIIVPASQSTKTSLSGPTFTISSSIQATPTVTSSSSASTKQAFLPQTSKTLIIKHSASTPQVITLIPASGHQPSGQLQLISPGQIIQKPQLCTSLAAKGAQQLIRPIFIAAQPSLQPPKATGVISKLVSSTPTVTTQAIFIATSPITHNRQQPTSTIKLALSPGKSIFAGAIPLIFSPQAPASSSSSLSCQLQNAISSLQSQQLATVPVITSQAPVNAAVQTVPPQPVSKKQVLPSERAPAASVSQTSNVSAAVVTTKSKQSSNHSEMVPTEILPSSKPTSSGECEELATAESHAAEANKPRSKNSEKEVNGTSSLGDEILTNGNTVSLSYSASPAASAVLVDSVLTSVNSRIKELLLLGNTLPSIVREKVCEQAEVAASSDILKYLPTLPGACTTAVAKSKEKLTVKIPLSKLIKNTSSAYNAGSISTISRKDHSPIDDLADISQIIKHTANIDLAICNPAIEPTQKQSDFDSSVPAAFGHSAPAPNSVAQSDLLSLPIRNALQRFVEIRPATTHSFMATSVTPILVSAPSVVNTTALRTPIVTPAVAHSEVEEFSKSSESLPISIKLVSVDSGVRLRNSKLVSTFPKSSQPATGVRNFPAQSAQTPLLPRPAQGYLTVLTRMPQLSNVLSNQIQRFPVTYLANLPMQINNQPRPPLVIQPTPRPFLSGPLQPSNQIVNTSNVRFGNQTMVIPVTLSLPGVNLHQVPATSNILMPSLCPIGSFSGLQQIQQTQAKNVATSGQSAVDQNITVTSRLQKVTPHQVTSIVAKQTIVSEFMKPFTEGNLVTVSGGFPAQTNHDYTTISKSSTLIQEKSNTSAADSGPSFAGITKPTPMVSIATVSMTSNSVAASLASLVSLPVASVTSCLTSQYDTKTVLEYSPSVASNYPSQDGIVGLTNSLKALLKTDITEGSTVTINIQGNPVTYALKDGKLFSMPHQKPAKKEKSSNVGNVVKSNPLSMENSDILPASNASTTPSVTVSNSTGLDVTLGAVSSHDLPISNATAPCTKPCSHESEPLSLCKRLLVSVPKRLLHRKTFRSKSASADIASHPTSRLSETQGTISTSIMSSVSPVIPVTPAVTLTVTSSTSTIASASISSIVSAGSTPTMPHGFGNSEVASSNTTLVSSSVLPATAPFHLSFTTSPASSVSSSYSCTMHQSLIANGKAVSTCFSATLSNIKQSHTTCAGPPTTHFAPRTMHIGPLTANAVPHTVHALPFSENKSQQDNSVSLKRSNSEPVDLKFGFECDFCSEKFESYNLMWRHRKFHLNETANFTGLRQPSIPRALCPKFIVCDKCNKVFQSNSDLQRHKQLENCVNTTVFRPTGSSNESDLSARFMNGRQVWGAADDINGVDLTFDLLTDDSPDVFQEEISPDIAYNENPAETANFGTVKEDSCVSNIRKRGTSMNDNFYDIAPNLIDSLRSTDKDTINGSEIVSNLRNENFDINANFEDQVFEDMEDVKPNIVKTKMRRSSSRSSLPRKRIVSRKNSHNANQKRIKRRYRVTISDDEEAVGDDGLDVDGEFMTVGKLNGEFTCSRCDLGFQNEEELDDHNESFHDSLRYNFRERRSVSNLDYLDELEFDFD